VDDLLDPVGEDVFAEAGFVGEVDDHSLTSDVWATFYRLPRKGKGQSATIRKRTKKHRPAIAWYGHDKGWQEASKAWKVDNKSCHVDDKAWKVASKAWKVASKAWKVASKAWKDDDKRWNVATKAWKVVAKSWKVDEMAWKVDGMEAEPHQASEGLACFKRSLLRCFLQIS
jgi:hypothetical protein